MHFSLLLYKQHVSLSHREAYIPVKESATPTFHVCLEQLCMQTASHSPHGSICMASVPYALQWHAGSGLTSVQPTNNHMTYFSITLGQEPCINAEGNSWVLNHLTTVNWTSIINPAQGCSHLSHRGGCSCLQNLQRLLELQFWTSL
jgi:hypothetical protein